MPLRKNNTRTLHRGLYAGQLVTIQLYKRNPDQQQGTVTVFKLFQCRRSSISRTGEPIQEDMTSDTRTTWMIPRTELDRVGVNDINAADRVVDISPATSGPNRGRVRWWQPEATTNISVQLFENYYLVDSLRVDPPKGQK